MNQHRCRRAFTMTEIIALLPIIAAITTMAYMTATHVEQMRSRENASRQDDAVLRDVVRRVQEDAARAVDASVSESPEGIQLALRSPDGVVTYATRAATVSRTEQIGDGEALRYEWSMRQVGLTFKIEAIGGAPRIAWIVATLDLPVSEGPSQAHVLSAAAVLGSGVMP